MSTSKTSATNEINIKQADIRRVLKNWHDSNKLGQDALASLGMVVTVQPPLVSIHPQTAVGTQPAGGAERLRMVKQQQLKEGYGDTYEGCAQALRSILQKACKTSRRSGPPAE